VPPGGGKNKETEEMITMLVRLVCVSGRGKEGTHGATGTLLILNACFTDLLWQSKT